MKKSISTETLSVYSNFSKLFVNIIHTDTSKIQLGAVIGQNNKPMFFYSTKLNFALINYTTTEEN